MTCVYVYQIVDQTSEGIVHTFLGPNDVFSERLFEQFLKDPKFKDRIIPSDFVLCRSKGVSIMDSFANDFCNQDVIDHDTFIVSHGDKYFDEVKDEA